MVFLLKTMFFPIKKHDFPIEKIFSETLREKFEWAFDVDEKFTY